MNRFKSCLVYGFAAFFSLAGVLHFVADDQFAAIVPPLLPFPYLIVWLTGLMEIGFAILLLCPHLRPRVGLWLSFYLLAVLPANIHMAMTGMPLGALGSSDAILWGRVALQFPLIGLIIWVTRTPRKANLNREILYSGKERP